MNLMTIYLFLLLISSIFSYIFFPLKKDNSIPSSSYKSKQEEVFSKFLQNNLYINLIIGSKKSEVKAYLIQSKTELIIAGKNIKNHKYDETVSTTYNITYEKKISFDYSMFSEGYLSKENFIIFNSNNNELNTFYLDFVLGTKTSSTYSNIREAEVGLHLPLLESIPDYNLITTLKKNNVTLSCNWYLDFDNFEKGEGKMIVDGFPHILNNKKYNKENFVKANAIDKSYTIFWGFKFSSINYGNRNLGLSLDLRAHFEFDYGIISASTEVGELFESYFFGEYISQNICFKQKIGVYGHYFFYCKKTEKFSIEKFETIYFNCADLEIIFELNYQDLFYTDEENIYFLIEFIKNTKVWTFGEMFLRKYYIVFNQEEKTVGYYLNMEKEKKLDNKNGGKEDYFLLYKMFIIGSVLIILLSCITILLFFIYKNKKNRKKKANELDDEYNYEPKVDVEDKNKNNLLNDDNNINSINT